MATPKTKVKKIAAKPKAPVKKELKVVFEVSEESMQTINAFYNTSHIADTQGVLDHKAAFYKSLALLRENIIRKEV